MWWVNWKQSYFKNYLVTKNTLYKPMRTHYVILEIRKCFKIEALVLGRLLQIPL